MDRASRINRVFVDILNTEERIVRQEERIASLDARGMHNAAARARETLMVMADRLLGLCATHAMMVNTVRLVGESRRAMDQGAISN